MFQSIWEDFGEYFQTAKEDFWAYFQPIWGDFGEFVQPIWVDFEEYSIAHANELSLQEPLLDLPSSAPTLSLDSPMFSFGRPNRPPSFPLNSIFD